MTSATLTPSRAQRTVRKARLILWGKSGSGKTMTALMIARGLCGPDGKICLIDTEIDASTLYADEYQFDLIPVDAPYDSKRLAEVVRSVAPHYDVVILDHASAEWNGEGGCLERVDSEKVKLGNNEWAAWSKITPDHHRFVNALLRAPTHIICTLRAKTVTEQQTNAKTGKKEVINLGLFPVQRYDGEEFIYEFDIAAKLEPEGKGVTMTVTNTRYRDWHEKTFKNPGLALGVELGNWLNKGVAPVLPPANAETTLDDDDRPPLTEPPPDPTPPPAIETPAPSVTPPAPPAAPEHATMNRGDMLSAYQQLLYYLIPDRTDAGRKMRAAILDECVSVGSMAELAGLDDGVLGQGLRRLQARTRTPKR